MLVAVVCFSVQFLVLSHGTSQAGAVGGYNNASIADIALGYVGQWGGNACRDAGRSGATGGSPGGVSGDGQCRAFVNCIIWMASSHAQWVGGGANYFSGFLNAGAAEITDVNQLAKGDVVQIGQGTHTYIIVNRVSGSTFQVVDSNHDYNETVLTYNRTVTLDSNSRAFRMGTVQTGPTDSDGDGTPDGQDRCPTQAGPAETAGCPDDDRDGVANLDDQCGTVPGWQEFRGCSQETAEPVTGDADFTGDGSADYCRLVGVQNNVDSRLQCTALSSTAGPVTYTSDVLDWGFRTGRSWVDFNGDRRADYCRRVGDGNNVNSHVSCTVSNGAGFGSTYLSGVEDWGYETGRGWADFNGDGKADYCRAVGVGNNVNSHVSCTVSNGTGFGATYLSGVTDWGLDLGRAWVDFNGDGKADYCRLVGSGNNVNSHVACTVSTGTGFGATYLSGVTDWGFDDGRAWVDFNGDGKVDFCRAVGAGNNVNSHASCTVSTGTGFGSTYLSGVEDWGYETGRGWADANGDGKADYCRRVGVGNNVNSHVSCTPSTGTGFATTYLSGVIDWGFDAGRAWVDANNDGKADYCRVVGATGAESIACLLQAAGSFGGQVSRSVADWGYAEGRSWPGASHPVNDRFHPLTPARILDSRPNGPNVGAFNTPWPANTQRDVTVAGVGGVPSGADAVVVNMTVTGTSAPSFLSVWPAGQPKPNPLVSSLNWATGQTVPNAVTAKVGAGGKITVYNAGGNVDAIIDVVGYFTPGTGNPFHPLPPARILDSRPSGPNVGAYTTPWSAGVTRPVAVTGRGGVPSSAVDSVLLNVTVTNTAGSSFLSIWPGGSPQPNPLVSSLNWMAGRTVPNAVTAKVGGGNLTFFNAVGTVDVIADVGGWYG